MTCPHCGLSMVRAEHPTYHEGQESCLDEVWRSVMFAPNKADAIEVLARYGRARFAVGHGEGISHERQTQHGLKRLAEDVAGAPD